MDRRFYFLLSWTTSIVDVCLVILRKRQRGIGERGGNEPDGRKVQGTIHWVSAPHAADVEVRLYDRLFAQPDPDDVPDGQDFLSALNPQSLVVIEQTKAETGVSEDPVGSRYQFERVGYFYAEPEDSTPEKRVFNRIVGLRDSWAKEVKKG